MSEFVLRVQLADIRQTEDVLDLLSFSFFLPHQAETEKCTIRFWSDGHWKEFDPTHSFRLLHKLNMVVVQRDFDAPRTLGHGINVLRARSVLTISPTSNLWADVTGSGPPFRDPGAESPRSYLESIAQALSYRSIAYYPSLIDVQLSLRANALSATDCLNATPAIIRDGFPAKLLGVPLMGVVDCSTVLSPGDLLTEQFMTQNDYLEIGRHFPALHPVLIGEYEALSKMKEIIGDRAELLGVSSDSKFKLGILRILPDILAKAETYARLASWLAINSETMHFAGEYELGGGKVLSLRRSRELESTGVLSPLPDGFVRYLLVSAAHCKMIGIDPEDMLTYIGPASQVMKTQAMADREFSRVDPALPARDRIWQAYERTAFTNMRPELRALVKRLYFVDAADRRIDA